MTSMPFIPPEISDIILENLLDINPFLCAKISKYWYYLAMPKIWNDINLNTLPLGYTQKPFMNVNTYVQKRAYNFYTTYIHPTNAKLKNANCLKFIRKLEPNSSSYPRTIVNILKKCPNLEEMNFASFKEVNIPYEAILKYNHKVKSVYITRYGIYMKVNLK
jgi:hypothetical protein